MKEYAINLCEILPLNVDEKWLNTFISAIWKQGSLNESRIYVGSYFCDSYFLKLSKLNLEVLNDFFESHGVKVTLVIPICMESALDDCKRVVDIWLNTVTAIDELVVNDLGMAEFVKGKNKIINLGRLFMKETRDPRNKNRVNLDNKAYCWNSFFQQLCDEFKITGMEADLFHMQMNYSAVPSNFTVACHKPYAYITTGHICAFRSVNKAGNSKFLVDTDCQMECFGNCIFYNVDKTLFLKYGKTCYFPSYPADLIFDGHIRELYWPVEELKKHENISSFK